MSLRFVVSALLLFTAAAGWSFTPAPDGAVGVLQSSVAAQNLRSRTLPLTCLLLGAATLAVGWHHRHERETP